MRWWRWSFSFWGWSQMCWWVRRSAARSTRRGCRSMPVTGNGWLWGRWCWRSLESGFDCPGWGGGRWGCEGTNQQLVWQTDHLPASGTCVVCTWDCVCEREKSSDLFNHVCVFMCMRVRRFKRDRKRKEVKSTDGQMHKQINIRRTGTERGWEKESGRWGMKRWRRKKTIGETNRWGGVSEKKDTAVSQHIHLSRSFCVVSPGTHPHSRYIPGKGRCLNAILICSLPLSPSPSPATPLNTEYLSTNTKQKGIMRAFSHTDTHCYFELEWAGRPSPS